MFTEKNSRPEPATQFDLLTFSMKVSKERWTSWRKRNETRFASLLAYDLFNQSKLSCCLLSLDLLSRTFHKSRDFPALSACSIAFAPSRCSRFSRAFSRLHGFNFHSLVCRRVTCCCVSGLLSFDELCFLLSRACPWLREICFESWLVYRNVYDIDPIAIGLLAVMRLAVAISARKFTWFLCDCYCRFWAPRN